MSLQKGDDLAGFVLAANRAGVDAAEAGVRRAAFGTRNDLRRIIKRGFGKEWRVVGGDKGFADAIIASRKGSGWYRVRSKALYVHGRTQPVDLLWVFDTGPAVRSGKGKPYVAIPLPGKAPLASNGRRYAWPSEAERMGWELDFARVQGKDSVIVFGRRGGRGAFQPMWVLKPSIRDPKRIDLDGIYRRRAAQMDSYWAADFEKQLGKALTRQPRGSAIR